jgi:hypothetical protein
VHRPAHQSSLMRSPSSPLHQSIQAEAWLERNRLAPLPVGICRLQRLRVSPDGASTAAPRPERLSEMQPSAGGQTGRLPPRPERLPEPWSRRTSASMQDVADGDGGRRDASQRETSVWKKRDVRERNPRPVAELGEETGVGRSGRRRRRLTPHRHGCILSY